MVTRMREKGQVTIPASIRESLHLERDSVLSVAKVGEGILLVPRSSRVEPTAAKFVKAAKEKGITLEEVLKDLKKIRRQKP